MNRLPIAFAIIGIFLSSRGGSADSDTTLHSTKAAIILARGNAREIRILDLDGKPKKTLPGPAHPRVVVSSPEGSLGAVLDPIDGRVDLVSLEFLTSTRLEVDGATAAVFTGEDLFVLCRDARLLVKLDASGSREQIRVPLGAALLRSSGGAIYVYSPITGTVESFDAKSLKRIASHDLPKFASDLEVGPPYGYLAFPGEARLVAFSLSSLTEVERFDVGAVPIDIELTGVANVLSSGSLLIADPSSKRVWQVDATQSTASAAGRGFLRGLLGLSIAKGKGATFPSAVDRIIAAHGRIYAYDSAQGVLYATRGGSRQSAIRKTSIPSHRLFAITSEGLMFWDVAVGRVRMIPH